MEDKIKVFLASGKLEEYVYGVLDVKDQQEVERFIKKYPEVNKEYLVLQDQLEKVSRQQSIKAPTGMKSQILESLPEKNIAPATANYSWVKYLAITGLVASIMLAWAWNKSNTQLQEEKENYAQLAKECEERETQIEAQSQLIAFFYSEQTQRFEMKGNGLAPDFKAIVFVNEPSGKAMISPTRKLELPKNKCVQIWGDLDGEMIPIAVLNDVNNDDYDFAINPEFTSLNLTIEEKTADGKGQLHPDVSQLIASVII